MVLIDTVEFGHGVGMSQVGAFYMVLNGYDCYVIRVEYDNRRNGVFIHLLHLIYIHTYYRIAYFNICSDLRNTLKFIAIQFNCI